ncbi:MAG TPA: S9 family peptidase [Opitutae bacterium]|nr:S9 family peptidase [Opitutae bacterium]
MCIALPRIVFYLIGLPLAATVTNATEALPLVEARKQFTSWDRSMYNGLLYNTEWSEDGTRFAYNWIKDDGKTVRRELDCTTGTVRDVPSTPSPKKVEQPKTRGKSIKLLQKTINGGTYSFTSGNQKWKVSYKDNVLAIESVLAAGKTSHRLAPSVGPENFWEGTPSWSPDGSHFAIWLTKKVNIRKLTVREASTGKETTTTYAVAGDALPESRAWVFSVATGVGTPVPTKLLENIYSVNRLDWTPDGTRLRTEYVLRGFAGFGILEFDTRQAAWRKVVDEFDPKFSFQSGLHFRHDLDAETSLWVSERTGWSHLYRIDLRTGSTLNAVTAGAWVMRKVVHVDSAQGFVLVEALGLNPDENPYQAHLCRVNLDGTGFTDLTPSNTHHEINLSPNGRYFLDTASRPDLAPTYTVRRTNDGSVVATLGTADISRAIKAGWAPPIPFHTKDRDGKFDIWGVIHRPKPFDPKKRYPVLEHIYAGPHDSFTQAGFTPWWYDVVREPNINGFYVVQIDGLGTRNRGREFHQRAWQNLRDAGLPDRILWIQSAAKLEPQMDLSRIGIFGGSAGGQNTVFALLDHGDFYRAGAADCGCYDNRVDKIWWNEQWLGWPVNQSYDYNRCANFAEKLRRPLLMTVGEIDTNVDPRSSTELRDAFIAAGKGNLVDFRIVPGIGHGAGEQDDIRQVRLNFFIKHLGVPEPR